jgi:hypothetical protein
MFAGLSEEVKGERIETQLTGDDEVTALCRSRPAMARVYPEDFDTGPRGRLEYPDPSPVHRLRA